jgi:ubiquitin C-terminal hydrolase
MNHLLETFNHDHSSGAQCLLLANYIGIVKLMWGHANTRLSPIAFLTLLGTALPQFKGLHPHDAHEFLVTLLYSFHEMISNSVTYKFNGSIITDMDYQINKAHQDWISYYKNKHSFILDIFGGQDRTQITCSQCHQNFYRFDPTLIHDVPIGGVKPPLTPQGSFHTSSDGASSPLHPLGDLMQCLDQLVMPEQLNEDNLYQCDVCHTKTRAQTTLTFWTIPRIMILKLNRFSHQTDSGSHKMEGKITYPVTGLDLSRYISSPLSGAANYDLYAVTCHVGSMLTGHYYSIVYNHLIKTWIIYNDGCTNLINDPNLIISPDAYILFYRRR